MQTKRLGNASEESDFYTVQHADGEGLRTAPPDLGGQRKSKKKSGQFHAPQTVESPTAPLAGIQKNFTPRRTAPKLEKVF
jgi:hypothetical protein